MSVRSLVITLSIFILLTSAAGFYTAWARPIGAPALRAGGGATTPGWRAGRMVQVGDTWTLAGQYEQGDDGYAESMDTVYLPGDAVVAVNVSSPTKLVWREGEGFTALVNFTLRDAGELSSLVLNAYECYLIVEGSGEKAATSGTRTVEVELTEGALVEEVQLVFTHDFNWTLLEEAFKSVYSSLFIWANFTLASDSEVEHYATELWMISVTCFPPGYFRRQVEITYTVNGLEENVLNVSVMTRYTLDGRELTYTESRAFNITSFMPGLGPIEIWEFIEWPYLFTYVDEPPMGQPLLSVEDWSSAGDSWVSYISELAESYEVEAEGNFTTEERTLAGRVVQLAIFGLDYHVESTMSELTGDVHLDWAYGVEEEVLMSVLWDEDLTYGWSSEGADFSYEEEGSRAIHVEISITGASFEFGTRPLPEVVLRSAELSSYEVYEGETVNLTVQVANEGESGAEDVLVRWFSPGFSGEHERTVDIGPGEVETVVFTLTAEEIGNTTVEVSVLYAGEKVGSEVLRARILMPVSLKSASLSSDEVLRGRSVELVVEVANEGGAKVKGVRVVWEEVGQGSSILSGEHEKTVDIGPGSSAKVSFMLTGEDLGNTTIRVSVIYEGHLAGTEELGLTVAEAVEPEPTTTATIATGAVAGAVAAGVSVASAGVSAAAAVPTLAPAAAPPSEARPGFLSKILSGIKYLLGKRRKRRVEPPKNSLKLTLGLVLLSAIFATVPLLLISRGFSLASIPTAVYTSSIGFTLALAGLSLFIRRVKFYRDMGITVDRREKGYLALTLILGLWGAFSSTFGLLSIIVPYLASIPLSASGAVVTAYTILDIRSWS